MIGIPFLVRCYTMGKVYFAFCMSVTWPIYLNQFSLFCTGDECPDFVFHLCVYELYIPYTLGKKIGTPRNGVPFWRLFIFYLLVRSKGRLVGRIYVFLCIVCTILFNRYFGKFVMAFIDIRKNGCMSIPKCHLMVLVINLVKQTWFFAWCCLQLVWFCVCRVSIGYSHL